LPVRALETWFLPSRLGQRHLEGTRLEPAERGYGGRCIPTRHRRMTMGGRPRASCLGAELGAPTAEQGKEAAVCDPTRRRSNAKERQGVAWCFKIPGIFRLRPFPASFVLC